MKKKTMRVLVLVFFLLINFEKSYAEIKNSIIMTIGNNAVTHLDLLNEIKLIAILSNTKVDKDNSEEIKNLAIKSIITKTLKNQEINRIGITTYNKKDLQNLVKGTAENLGLNKQEMKELLEKHNLSFDDLVKKFETDLKWNSMIFELYKNKLSLNTIEIENKIKSEVGSFKEDKIFLLSEIEISLADKSSKAAIKQVLQSIKDIGFENTAKELSISETSEKGGEIGWVKKSELSDKIYKNIKNLNIGELSQAIILPNSILFIKKNKEKNMNLNIETVKESIVNQEKNKKLKMFSNSHFSNLERSTEINFL